MAFKLIIFTLFSLSLVHLIVHSNLIFLIFLIFILFVIQDIIISNLHRNNNSEAIQIGIPLVNGINISYNHHLYNHDLYNNILVIGTRL